MKKWFAVAASALFSGALFSADLSQADILKRIEAMQKQIEEQQAAIQTLKSQLEAKQQTVSDKQVTEMVKQQVDAAIEKQALAQVKEEPALKLGKNIDGLELKGDLRLRYEYRELDDDGGNDRRQKTRFRTRFRLGMKWKNSTENFEIGAGLCTGGGDGRSTNDSWGNTTTNNNSLFETGDIRLDYAYAKYKWDCFSLTIGQHKVPFESSWLLWDSDLRPTGVTAKIDTGVAFCTLGAYNTISDLASGENVNGLMNQVIADAIAAGDLPAGTTASQSRDDSLANMYAIQLGARLENEDFGALIALALYWFDHENIEQLTGETAHWKDLGLDPESYDWHIADLYGEVTAKVREAKLKFYGDIFKNLGADEDWSMVNPYRVANNYASDDNDTGWVLGGEVGAMGFKLGYAYAHCEGDSAPYHMVNSDFGDGLQHGGMNAEGHMIEAGYTITKHCSVGVTAFFTEQIEPAANNDDDVSLYQFDLKYKF